jgi:hypothetical protein
MCPPLMQGCEVGAYPFSSLDKAVDIFLTGSPDAEVHRTKLALLVYACADAGIAIEADSIRCMLQALPAPAQEGLSGTGVCHDPPSHPAHLAVTWRLQAGVRCVAGGRHHLAGGLLAG